jgi:hypothetical protein
MKWSEDDGKFRRLLREGYRWQMLPYAYLASCGLNVEMPELSVRDSIHDAERWLETSDLIVTERDVRFVVQVKSRPFFFTDHLTWPKQKLPAFVDTTKKWDAQAIKPYAYVFVSQLTGCMLATRATRSARERWVVLQRRDSVRGFEEAFYAVGAEHLRPMCDLVDAIKKLAARKTA